MQQVIHNRVLAPIRARTAEEAGRFVATGSGIEQRAVNLLNEVFEFAVIQRGSDIHLELDDIDGMDVRVRRGGALEIYSDNVEPECARVAKTKICAKAKLDDQERLLPQDGRMMLYMGGRRVDIRVSLTPTVSGYKFVMRLLDSNNARADIDQLEMPFAVKQAMKHLAIQPEGLILLSGPTGSGKTTTLYALLQYVKDETRHIITIENPVEYTVKTFTQIDVDENMTFAKAMRASLRLDPDVIMVGEIRDEESACIAQKAGTSGHMVLSTVHSNSSPESITRLLSFGLKGFEVSSVLSAVVAQRLVKCIAPGSDLAWEPPTDVEREWLTKRGLYCPTMRLPRVIEGELAGMIPLVEMIEITDEIRRFLEAGEGDIATWVPRIMEMAIEQEQFETLAQAGVRLVLEGKTTLAEVVTAIRDGSYTPTRLRWEQRLTYQGILNVSDLERVKREIHERRMEGKIVGLKEVLLHQGLCTEHQIEMAIRETEVAAQE